MIVAGLSLIGWLFGGRNDPTTRSSATLPPLTSAPTTPPTTIAPPTTTTPIPSTTLGVVTPPPPTTVASGPLATARSLLATIPVKGRAPNTGYERSKFGPAWTDDVSVADGHNGCDTRNDILGRDLTNITYKPRTHDCVVLTGTLVDPYTARHIDFRRGRRTSIAVQIDHVVALDDAWQTGAQQLTEDRRRDLANDPMNLLAVDGPTNEQKGAGDAATWLPPNKTFRCRYVAIQVHVKARYQLWMTPPEHAAVARVLAGCGGTFIGPIG